MTTEEQAQIGAYVGQLADLIELRDWRFLVSDRLYHDDVGASINCVYGRKPATISLEVDWHNATPGEHRHHLTHELPRYPPVPNHGVGSGAAMTTG